MISLLYDLKLRFPIKAYWTARLLSVINFLIDKDMFFSREFALLLCNLIWRKHIFDFRSLIVSSFYFIYILSKAIDSWIFFIYFAFFLSISLSSLNKCVFSFYKFTIINFYYSWVSIIKSFSSVFFIKLLR